MKRCIILIVGFLTVNLGAQDATQPDNDWFYANYLEIMSPIRNSEVQADSQLQILLDLYDKYQQDDLLGPQYALFLAEAFTYHTEETFEKLAVENPELFSRFCNMLPAMVDEEDCDANELLIEFKESALLNIAGMEVKIDEEEHLNMLKDALAIIP